MVSELKNSSVHSARRCRYTAGVWGQEIDSMKLQWKVLLIDVLGTDAGAGARLHRPRSRAQAWKLSYMGPDSNVPQQKWKLLLNTSRYCYVDILWVLRFSKENRLWWIRSLSGLLSPRPRTRWPSPSPTCLSQQLCVQELKNIYHTKKIFGLTCDGFALLLDDHLAHGLVLLHLVLLVPMISITIIIISYV